VNRILFLSQLLPYPPDAGPKVRSYNVLKALAASHKITLLAFNRPEDGPEAISHLEQFCESVHTVPIQRGRFQNGTALAKSILTNRSFIIQRDYLPEMARKVRELTEKIPFSIVHADQLWMAQYALMVKEIAPGTRLVLDEHNACFKIFQRLAVRELNPLKKLIFERERHFLQRYEAITCSQFDQVVTVTHEDQEILKKLVDRHNPSPSARQTKPAFHTIPISVDTLSTERVYPQPDPKNILHLGTMFWLPNVEGVLWFARSIWPRVLARIPDATFTIVGKNPPAEIRELENNHSNGTNNGIEGRQPVAVTGYVPDPKPYLEKAGVFIVPLLSGSGMRVKILDAWNRGLPVVSTSIGAEGINYRNGENILIADGEENFAEAVIRVLCEPELAGRLRENGRKWVENHYDWRRVYAKWDQIYG
jgi:polysaccharide biosynthesis protein PslH